LYFVGNEFEVGLWWLLIIWLCDGLLILNEGNVVYCIVSGDVGYLIVCCFGLV